MYKFIKHLNHHDPRMSHVAFLYQDVHTGKYYLSHTFPVSESDTSNQYMLIRDEPKVTHLKHINIVAEVTPFHFALKTIHNYQLG